MLIAKHYIRMGNRFYTPGEVIDEQTADPARVAKLVHRGAIMDTKAEAENAEAEDPSQALRASSAKKGARAEKKAEVIEEPEGTDDNADPEEFQEDPEAPEIDVSDVVVAPKKTTRKTTKKKG